MSGMTMYADPLDAGADKARREFLTCLLGEETYGIDILKVQEIRGLERVTRVPRVAHCVRGVINLRGSIVPIVDLGLMFGFPAPIPLDTASAIVLNVDKRLVGLVVESVADAVALADDEILPVPELADRAVAEAICGIGTRREPDSGVITSILLLDVDRLLARIRDSRE
jgi:purine-binding chemotaxis protein CheW